MLKYALVIITVLVGAPLAHAATEYELAVERTKKLTDGLQSYLVTGTMAMENKVAGQPGGQTMEIEVRAGAMMPDQLFSSQSGTMFSQNLGSGPGGSWLYVSQLGNVYQGPQVQLSRDLGLAQEMGLEPERIFNFFAGLNTFLLDPGLEVFPEAGTATVTIGDREVACTIFRTVVSELASELEGPRPGPRTFWFDPESGLVLKSVQTAFGEQRGMEVEQVMTFTLDSYTLDEPVPDDEFSYDPPQSARVVDSLEKLINPDSMVGEKAPEISFTDLEGKTFQLSDFRGKVVFLDIWATWCGPCKQEMPHIQSLYDEMSKSGEVVFLAASSEEKATITGFLKKNPYTFQVVMAEQGDVVGKYKATSIPSGFVIDTEGIIRAHAIGAQTEGQLRAMLAKAGVGK